MKEFTIENQCTCSSCICRYASQRDAHFTSLAWILETWGRWKENILWGCMPSTWCRKSKRLDPHYSLWSKGRECSPLPHQRCRTWYKINFKKSVENWLEFAFSRTISSSAVFGKLFEVLHWLVANTDRFNLKSDNPHAQVGILRVVEHGKLQVVIQSDDRVLVILIFLKNSIIGKIEEKNMPPHVPGAVHRPDSPNRRF